MTDADRIAALEAAVATLQHQLDSLLARRPTTLRRDGRCTACGNPRLLHIKHVAEGRGYGLAPLAIGNVHDGDVKEGDPLVIFVCRACGFVEWYATGFGHLEVDGKAVVAIEPESPPTSGDPYR